MTTSSHHRLDPAGVPPHPSTPRLVGSRRRRGRAAAVILACRWPPPPGPAASPDDPPPPTPPPRRRPPPRPPDRQAAAHRPLPAWSSPSRAQLAAPAVVVKIDNMDAARPQTGINQADVVYEEMVEGGLTRLAAVFQSQYPTSVGSGALRASHRRGDRRRPQPPGLRLLGHQCRVPADPPIPARHRCRRRQSAGPSSGAATWPPAPHNLYASVASLAGDFDDARPAAGPSSPIRRPGATFGGPGLAPAGRIIGLTSRTPG